MVGGSTGLAGRDAEVARLVAVARDGALLVAGEAGSGKTAIVRAAADVLAGEVAVLWTAALPLATVAAPLLPLRTALVRGDDGGYRAPESAFGPGDDATAAFDTWLARIRGDRPALLVVDDLQWADPSSLDVLT
jgi:predicted ATPase